MRENDLRLTTACPAKLTACCGPLRRSSGFRIALLAAPSRPDCRDSGTLAAFVPGHSSASATDFHRASLNCKGPNEADCSVVSVGPPPFVLHLSDKSAGSTRLFENLPHRGRPIQARETRVKPPCSERLHASVSGRLTRFRGRRRAYGQRK